MEVRKDFQKGDKSKTLPKEHDSELQAGVCKPARLGGSQHRHRGEAGNARHS